MVNNMDKEIINNILKFRDDRNWKQYHNPKDLAISISLEAAELLDNFQWTGWEEAVANKKDKLAEELADVLMYCILMADSLDLDIDTIIEDKLEQNKKKYPIDKAYGKKDKYNEL